MIAITPNSTNSDSDKRPTPDLSIAVPLYNEVDNVGLLYERIVQALDPTELDFEIIMVDDGSSDGTRERLKEIALSDRRVRAVLLKANYGQTAAMRAGIEHTRGRIVVTMDGDLQNDPQDIPTFVKKIEEGYDLVAGWRRDRKDPIISRKIPSKIANWLIRRMTHVPIHDTGCSLKAYRAELIRQLPLYSELHRFIPAMSTLATDQFAEVVVKHHPRQFGVSKYGLSRIGRVLVDVMTVTMLISSSRKPLHWFGLPAMGCFAVSAIVAALAAWNGMASPETATFVLPVVALLLGYLSIHLMTAGLFGELVVRSDPSSRVEPLTHQVQLWPKQSRDEIDANNNDVPSP